MRSFFSRIWEGVKERARGKNGDAWLVWISFVEALVLPVPTEPFLAAAVVANRRRWVLLAFLTTTASVLGAFASYLIGFFAFSLVEPFLLHAHDFTRILIFVAEEAQRHAFLITFAASFSFIPFTPLILLEGFFAANIWIFILASLLGRGVRFFATAYIVQLRGDAVVSREERIIASTVLLFLVALIAWGTFEFSSQAPLYNARLRANYSAILKVLHDRHILPTHSVESVP